MHLSEENNRADIVIRTIERKELRDGIQVLLAGQDKGFDWLNIQG